MSRRLAEHVAPPAASAAAGGLRRAALPRRGSLVALAIWAAWLAPPALAAEACSPEKMAEIRAAPTETEGSVLVDCNPTLSPDDVITRSLFFTAGSVSNGVVVDCAGATLDSTPLNVGNPRIVIQSRRWVDAEGNEQWDAPRGITIRNCQVLGSLNVIGMGGQDAEAVRLSSQTRADHVQRMREAAPSDILLENLSVTVSERIPVYLAMGSTGVTLKNSRFAGSSFSVAVYLDAESGFHRIVDNHFSVQTAREVIAVDGSSDNLIQGNTFHSTPLGGIHLYRNCGEAGTVRHNLPQRNDIVDNLFIDPSGPAVGRPHIHVASRNGNRSYCELDAGYPFGSSVDNLDHAEFTAIKGNHFAASLAAVRLDAGPSYLIDNTATHAGALPLEDGFGSTFHGNLTLQDPRPSTSCWSRQPIASLLKDRAVRDLDLGTPNEVRCAPERQRCVAGVLTEQPPDCANDAIVRQQAGCSAELTGADLTGGACSQRLACTAPQRLRAVKVACDLNQPTLDPAVLAAVPWNTLQVVQTNLGPGASHCKVAGYQLSAGATQLLRLPGGALTASCKNKKGRCAVQAEIVCK